MIRLAQFGQVLEDEECELWRLAVGHVVNRRLIEILALYRTEGLEGRETRSQRSLRFTMIRRLERNLEELCRRLILVIEDHLIPWDRIPERGVFYSSMYVLHIFLQLNTDSSLTKAG